MIMRGVLPRFVVGVDGVASVVAINSKDWLLSMPDGAYSTARTCSNAKRLFEWDTHIARTASSARAMIESEAGGADLLQSCAPLTQPELLGPRLTKTVAAAMREWLGASPQADAPELKVTVHVSWRPEHVACHVAALPPMAQPPVKVEVRGSPRGNAAAKASSWVAERAPLEALKRDDINELLLANASGEILEGSQTNFYAIHNGAVHTAADGVLAGTGESPIRESWGLMYPGAPVKLPPGPPKKNKTPSTRSSAAAAGGM